MRLRLDPADEHMHPLEAASNFNESMYFNVYDPREQVGGFLRLGNRANEGYAEMTTCIYLPDGRVAFTYHRPEISDNDAFDAGGMRFEVIEPFEALRASYHGKICLLERPLEMADPRKAFTENPWTDCAVELDYRGISPMLGGEPVNDDGSQIEENPGEGFARGHYEQHVARAGSSGSATRNGRSTASGCATTRGVRASGSRHGGTAGSPATSVRTVGFVVSIITARDGAQRIGGVWLEDGKYSHLTGATIETDWRTDDQYHERIRAVASVGDTEHVIEGTVLSLIPLRNRRTAPDGEQLVTRISEGMTEWRCDGRVGYGLSEYLDQIVDGHPVGVAA